MNKKSILLIGNGASLRNCELGTQIDKFDDVIRINNWKTKGYEKDVGTKVTIWAMYNPLKGAVNFINDYKEMGLTAEQINSVVRNIDEIWYVCWNPDNILNNWKRNQSIRDIDIYDKCKRHISIQTSKKIRQITDPPSTGFSLIWLLNRMYERIYIVGFDFLGELNPRQEFHHYYGNKMSENVLRENIHQMEYEAKEVKRLIKIGKITYLTKDSQVLKSNQIEIPINIICHICGKEINRYSWESHICNYCENEL